MDNVANFAVSTLAAGIAAGATSMSVATGEGAAFPDEPFTIVIWDRSSYSRASLDPNKEIIRVLVKDGDDFTTIVRGQEGTGDSAHDTSGHVYEVTNSPTAGMFETIATAFADQSAGQVWAGPVSGGADAPGFRSLTATDFSFLTPGSVLFGGEDGELAEDNDVLHYDAVNKVLTFDVEGGLGSQTDLASWALSTFRITKSVDSSAGQYLVALQPYATDDSGAVGNYEKAALLIQAKTNDPSEPGSDRDMVGIDSRGIIASTNPTGRAWGGAFQGVVEDGGDGYAIACEFSIDNEGVDQPLIGQTNSKNVLNVITTGNGATAAINIFGSGGGFHKGLYMNPTHILGTHANDSFIELLDTWKVKKDGSTFVTGGVNNLTLLTLKRNTDTAPTGKFVDFQNAAGGSLFSVNVAGLVTTANGFSGPTHGVIDGSNATAGDVGEYITATLALGSETSLTTATGKTVISISLTAGDWDVWGTMVHKIAATTNITLLTCSIGTVDNTLNAAVEQRNHVAYPGVVIGAGSITQNAPMTRISVSGTTTVYLVALDVFSVSTISAYGFISARRVR